MLRIDGRCGLVKSWVGQHPENYAEPHQRVCMPSPSAVTSVSLTLLHFCLKHGESTSHPKARHGDAHGDLSQSVLEGIGMVGEVVQGSCITGGHAEDTPPRPAPEPMPRLSPCAPGRETIIFSLQYRGWPMVVWYSKVPDPPVTRLVSFGGL